MHEEITPEVNLVGASRLASASIMLRWQTYSSFRSPSLNACHAQSLADIGHTCICRDEQDLVCGLCSLCTLLWMPIGFRLLSSC